MNMCLTQVWQLTAARRPSLIILFVIWWFFGSFRSKTQCYTKTTHDSPSVCPLATTICLSWTYLYQSCPASTSLVKIGCCHTLLYGRKWLSYQYFPHFLTDSCEIWYTSAPHKNVKQLPVSRKRGNERQTLSRRMEPTAKFILNFSYDFDQNIVKSHVQKIC